jgi:hypothetical protein
MPLTGLPNTSSTMTFAASSLDKISFTRRPSNSVHSRSKVSESPTVPDGSPSMLPENSFSMLFASCVAFSMSIHSS